MDRMKRDLPEHAAPPPPDEIDPSDGSPSSLLASRAFWLGGLVSLAIWVGVISLIYLAVR